MLSRTSLVSQVRSVSRTLSPLRRLHVALPLALYLVAGSWAGGVLLGSSAGSADSVVSSSSTPAEPFSIPAAELLAEARALEPPTDATSQILRSESTFSFDDEHRLVRSEYRLFVVLQSAALSENAEVVQAAWSPWRQDRPEIEARVIDAGGTERRLDPETLVVEPVARGADDIYSDRRMLSAPLPGVGEGSVVEWRFTVRDREPIFQSGVTGRSYVHLEAPQDLRRIVIEAPSELPLRYRVHLPAGQNDLEPSDLEPTETTDGHRRRLTFVVTDLSAGDYPTPALPPDVARYAHIAFATGTEWNDLAAEYATIVDRQITGADLEELRQPPLTAKSPVDRAQGYLQRLHERVRYTGLELGQASVVPATPGQVLDRRYGDCKDQASLLVALLRADGIDASVALLDANLYGEKDVDPDLPGFGGFDHAIVFIPGNPATWIDPTDPYSPAGTLPLSSQERWALVADEATETLVKTSSSSADSNLDLETIEVHFADRGPGRIVETTEYRGSRASAQRALIAATTEDTRRENYETYMEAAYFGDFDGFDEKPGEPRDPFLLELRAHDAATVVAQLQSASFAIDRSGVLSQLPAGVFALEDEEREAEVYFFEPYTSERRYVIHPPPGLVPRDLPEPVSRQIGAAQFEESFELDADGTLRGVLRFSTGDRRRLSLEDFEALDAALRDLVDDPILEFAFEDPGAVAIDEGRSIEAVEAYRSQIAEAPDESVHRLRFAASLLTLGMGAEARDQARRATELFPDVALAHWALANALQHDEIGRLRQGDFLRDEALASLDRALEIDPDDDLFLLEKAILLEHDAQGVRYGDSEESQKAVELYDRWLEDHDSPVVEANRLFALWAARDLERVLELTEQSADARAVPAIRLAARALTDGHRAATAEVAGMGLSAPHQALAAASQLLSQRREYATAGAMLRQAARTADESIQLMASARVIEQARRHETLEFDAETPEGLVRTFVQYLATPDRPERLVALFEPPLPLEAVQSLGDLIGAADLASVGGLDQAIDLALTNFETTVEGDEVLGYRVQASSRLDSNRSTPFYVRRVDDRLRLIAPNAQTPEFAVDLLRRLDAEDRDADDLRSIRQWLDWARRETSEFRLPEDPYSAVPFRALWPEATAELGALAMRTAVQVLIVDSAPELDDVVSNSSDSDGLGPEDHDAWTERLASARDAFDARLESEAEADARRALESAALEAEQKLGLHHAVVDRTARLLEESPHSTRLWSDRLIALHADDREDEAMTEVREVLETRPGDSDLRRLLSSLALDVGEWNTVESTFQELERRGELSSFDYNQWAWASLFDETLRPRALSLAERAAQRAEIFIRGSIHTLATAYAWNDRPHDAYRVLLKATEYAAPDLARNEIGHFDWLVIGRIAESYGFTERAASYYERVEESESEGSSWTLAQERLALLSRAAD